MEKVYITGSSLTCALGNNKSQSINKALQITQENYLTFFNPEDPECFQIKHSYSTQKEKFNSIIETVVKDAVKDADLTEEEQKELHIFIGSTSMSMAINEEQCEKHFNQNDPKMLQEIGYGNIATFVENLVNSPHKAIIIQTACTSTANCISYAKNYMKKGKIKKALILGIELFNKSTYDGFGSLMLPSQSGIYRPFDKKSDGLILGESCSAVILELEKRTPNDFEVIDSQTTFDNHSITGSNPTGEATLKCMQQLLDKNNMDINDLTALKAHATGTENSNLSEAKAIDALFEHYHSKCDVIILKPYLGHTLGSCGTSETILLCEFLKNNILPATLNYEENYSNITFTPLQETKKLNKATILFQFIGFGGSNTALLLSNKEK